MARRHRARDRRDPRQGPAPHDGWFDAASGALSSGNYWDRNAIQGDLVEGGVWKGGAAGAMAIAHLSSNNPPFRNLDLFDSWQGLPEPRADVDGAAELALASGNG